MEYARNLSEFKRKKVYTTGSCDYDKCFHINRLIHEKKENYAGRYTHAHAHVHISLGGTIRKYL